MRAVLWDMDGTLVDTEPVWRRCEAALVGRFGGHWTPEQSEALLGQALPVTAAALRAAGVDLSEDETVEALMADVIGVLRDDPPWCPGARDLLLALHSAGIPMALVTMSYRPLVDAFLGTLPEGLFSAVVTGDAVSHGKPDPEPYLTALAALGVDAAQALAVEDSPPGIAAATGAGVPTLAVPPPGAGPQPRPGLVVRDGLAGLDVAGLGDLWDRARGQAYR